jgi:peptide/nickel transport system substrate-binding protein
VGGMLALLLAACAPTQAGGPAASPASQPSQPAARKVLTLGTQLEPPAFIQALRPGGQGGGNAEVEPFVHDNFVVSVEYEVFAPQMVEELPSLEKGTWRVNPDGSMDVIWKLRPNIRWHDGQPLTSDDLLFTFQVHKDPEIPHSDANSTARLRESASAPDAQTFVMHWSGPYAAAYRTGPGGILPKHILGDLYENDKQSLSLSSFFTTDFVGLGPYKLVKWELGSHLELGRFDDYYQGRPKLDTLYVRFVKDGNALLANVLSGTADVVISGSSNSIDLEAASDTKQRWEGTGNQVITLNTGRLIVAEAQWRPEYVKPKDAVGTSLAVRKALYHALDRQALVNVMTNGLAPVADSYFPPNHALRKELEPFIPQYPFDPTRASQLFAEAGWTRGSDGVLTRNSNGDRFEQEIWAREGSGNDKMITVIADYWKQVGVAQSIYVIPAAQRGNAELEATRSGFLIVNPGGNNPYEIDRLHTKNIPSAANRWSSNNYGGYSNPKADALVDKFHATLDPREQLPIQQQLVQELTGDVAWMPLYWQVSPVLLLKGVKGPNAASPGPTANPFEWDKES